MQIDVDLRIMDLCKCIGTSLPHPGVIAQLHSHSFDSHFFHNSTLRAHFMFETRDGWRLLSTLICIIIQLSINSFFILSLSLSIAVGFGWKTEAFHQQTKNKFSVNLGFRRRWRVFSAFMNAQSSFFPAKCDESGAKKKASYLDSTKSSERSTISFHY